MSNYRLLLESVELADADAIKALQKKLNQWKTQGLLLKFSTNTAGDYALFTIALRTKAVTPDFVTVIDEDTDESPF